VYDGEGDSPSQIKGYDPVRRVTNVTFENFVRNGRTVLGPTAGNLVVGPHVSNVVFRRQPATRTVGSSAASIRYTGRWQRRSQAASHGGEVRSPMRVGSAMQRLFSGKQARVYGVTGPGAGKVDVLVDGKRIATVDTFSAVARAQQIWFDTGVLRDGPHVLELRYRGQKNVLATGAAVGFDKLELVR
jgi:hypothetical protein